MPSALRKHANRYPKLRTPEVNIESYDFDYKIKSHFIVGLSMIEKIKKRDGRIVEFDKSKIANAVFKAFIATKSEDGRRAGDIAAKVVEIIEKRIAGIPGVEDVQDIVEEVLIKNGYSGVAKAYILYREKRARIRKAKELLGVRDELKLPINAVRVLKKRYLLKDDSGNATETPLELFRRIAKAVALDPGSEEEFFNILSNLDFLPNSPTLMNAGTDIGQLSACFVIPVEDSLTSIFDAVKSMALIQQSGGGTGFSFSRLRPSGDVVRSTHGVASGPVSFMRVFDTTTDVIKQGGCISTKSLIRTNKGVLPIGKLLDCPTFGDNPTRYLVYTNGRFENAFIAEDNNIAEVYDIKTEIGTDIKVTPDHRICVIDGEGKFSWKEAGKLQEGDWIVHMLGGHCSNDVELPVLEYTQHYNANPIKIPETMSPELAELLGIYMADGCISTNGRIIFAVEENDIELKERIMESMLNIFCLNLGIEQRKPNDKSVCLVFYSRDLCKFFEKVECRKESSLYAFVPSVIFESSAESARAFIRGLFEGDGDIHADGYPRLYSSSERLVKEVQQLLFGLNMVSIIHKYYSENRYGKNPIYHLCIIQEGSKEEFTKKIGFISKRKNEKLSERQKPKAFEYFDVIPNQEKLFRKIYNGPGRGCGKGRTKRGANRKLYRALQHFLGTTSSRRNLTRKKLKELLNNFNELRCEQLLKIIDDDYFYSRVATITKEKDYTMDIMVPVAEHFVSNSILVHNKRRGANMGILRADHPDIIEFITAKTKEGFLTNFNISVAVDDKFMTAVKLDGDYELINPRNNEVVKKVRARDIWNLIITMAWRTGDPGIVFIDEINRHNPTPNVGMMESTNPCVVGKTLISTENGLIRMKDLVEKYPNGGIKITMDNRVPMQIVNRDGTISLIRSKQSGIEFNKISKAFCVGEKETYRIVTESGYELICTADHKVLTDEGWVKAVDLNQLKHKILIQSGEGKFSEHYELPFEIKNEFVGGNGRKYSLNLPDKWSKELGQVLGWLVGDGWLRDIDKNCRVGFTFSNQDRKVMDYFKPIINIWYGSDIKEVKRENGVYHLSYHSKYFMDFFRKLGIKAVDGEFKTVPESIFTAPKEAVVGFLQGLFTADGTVNFMKDKSSYARLTSKSIRLLKDAQILLLNLGIKSKIYDRSRQPLENKFNYLNKNGESRKYGSNGICFELEISKESVMKFLREIGFLCELHKDKISKFFTKGFYSDKFEERIKYVEENGCEFVYDLTEPRTLSFISNGIVSLDCGEQPLLPYESCNLGSINLAKMVKDDAIDREKLEKTVNTAVRFLDNVIDINKYPLAQTEAITKANRKIGLGVMGFADMLVQLGIPYNSEEALKTGKEVMGFIQEKSHAMSERLADERGAFTNCKGSIYKKPIRNATVTTVAPTGSISIIAGCSSGIEPLFAISFVRNVMEGTKLLEVNPYFEAVARERGFYSEELMMKIAKHGILTGINEVPEDIKRVFVTAFDVAPQWHVRMQAAFQKHCDNAVSKTINFPNDVDIMEVERVFMLAYELKCKGITVYRYDSKSQQVLYLGDALDTCIC